MPFEYVHLHSWPVLILADIALIFWDQIKQLSFDDISTVAVSKKNSRNPNDILNYFKSIIEKLDIYGTFANKVTLVTLEIIKFGRTKWKSWAIFNQNEHCMLKFELLTKIILEYVQ